MQSDVKRMLACSTMAQMGFMFVQCGLGLFPLAVAHLFWHGMFKAYLFLASGSAAQEKRFDLNVRPSTISFIYAFLCGLAGSFVFAYTSNKSWFAGDSSLVLMVIVLLAGIQLSLSILHTLSVRTLLISLVSTITAALVYGVSVYSIAWFIAPMKLMYPQPLNILHIGGIILLSGAWLSSVFIRNLLGVEYNSPWMLKSYVESLNASQPHSDTVTSHRNHYQYQ